MAQIPAMSVRCAHEHQHLIRKVAKLIRELPGFADSLSVMIERSDSLETPVLNRVDRLDYRINQIERQLADVRQAAGQGGDSGQTAVALQTTKPASLNSDDMRKKRNVEIVRMYKKGFSTKDIVAKLGVNASTCTRARQEAEKALKKSGTD